VPAWGAVHPEEAGTDRVSVLDAAVRRLCTRCGASRRTHTHPHTSGGAREHPTSVGTRLPRVSTSPLPQTRLRGCSGPSTAMSTTMPQHRSMLGLQTCAFVHISACVDRPLPPHQSPACTVRNSQSVARLLCAGVHVGWGCVLSAGTLSSTQTPECCADSTLRRRQPPPPPWVATFFWTRYGETTRGEVEGSGGALAVLCRAGRGGAKPLPCCVLPSGCVTPWVGMASDLRTCVVRRPPLPLPVAALC
jgi:hypothetical protein